MSTLTGLILGIVLAGAVTVFYGPELNARAERVIAALASTVPGAGSGPVTADPPSLAPEKEMAITNAASSASTSAAGAAPAAEQAPAAETAPAATPVSAAAEATAADGTPPAPVASASSAPSKQRAGPAGALGEPSRPSLQRLWADYAERADSLAPAGSFRWRSCFKRAAAAHDVPESLLLAVASGESGFDTTARSDKDAIGLMQIRWPLTSRHLGIRREADLYDPCTNVDAGARYLAELGGRYGGDLHRTLAAYNYGPGRIGDGPLPTGAEWYSQYIYQHLKRVLGRPHVPSSTLLAGSPKSDGGFVVLTYFNQPYRARQFADYLAGLAPDARLAHRSESLGRHEVVLLYESGAERDRSLSAIRGTGLLVLQPRT